MRAAVEKERKVEKRGVDMKDSSRRNFIKTTLEMAALGIVSSITSLISPMRAKLARATTKVQPEPVRTGYNPYEHYYSYVINLHKCIGCGSCVRACKLENDVPTGFYRNFLQKQLNWVGPGN